ncbi:hypothetical protein FOA52_008604 [Chlamydomonas sp. UWO 241]|nr:hypothetical protein FOA52_008604 [Chlamydomonas sp. UWO 241]
MAHYKDALDKYGQIDTSFKMAMAPPKVTLYQYAFIAFKIENHPLFPGGKKEQRGATHAERSLAEMIELKGLVEAPLGATRAAAGEALSLASTSSPRS